MKPIVAVVGRPNVGKSTLVNRLAQTSDAIVHESRGVTRDRSYHTADWNGREFTIGDTGGIEPLKSDDVFATSIRDQALAASGLLSSKMFGPSVQPPRPKLGLASAFGGSTDWETSHGEDKSNA